jgi:hypothetical protein
VVCILVIDYKITPSPSCRYLPAFTVCNAGYLLGQTIVVLAVRSLILLVLHQPLMDTGKSSYRINNPNYTEEQLVRILVLENYD